MTSSGPGPELDISPGHQEWLAANNASVTLNNEALQTWAAQLRAPIEPEPRVHLSEIGPLPSTESNIIVDWQTASEELIEPDHQLQLTGALGVALLTLKQEVQRRRANAWGGLMLLGSGVTAAVGELFLKNDVVQYGGMGMFVATGLGLAVINTRRKPETADVEIPEAVALRLERSQEPSA